MYGHNGALQAFFFKIAERLPQYIGIFFEAVLVERYF